MLPTHIGRYQLIGELGRGGMATVYRAHDPGFGRDVAIKVLPRELLHDPSFRARFDREARLIAALEHPAIVPVYDYGEDQGQPFIVMRLMSGGSLADRLQAGVLSVQTAARILTALAPAIDRAHARGIIHRDLKPSNILFDEDGNPYLSDFGIARLTETSGGLTGTALVGTPAYMSPEQAKGAKDLDARSDLYALGAIVFEMLTARRPYEADTPLSLAIMHVTEPVPRIHDCRPDLPPAAQTLIDTAMAKAREARYPSAAALASDLARLPVPAEQGAGPDARGLPQAPTRVEPAANLTPAPWGLASAPTALEPIAVGADAQTGADQPPALPPAGAPDAASAPGPQGPGRLKLAPLFRQRGPLLAGGILVIGAVPILLLLGLGLFLAARGANRPAASATLAAVLTTRTQPARQSAALTPERTATHDASEKATPASQAAPAATHTPRAPTAAPSRTPIPTSPVIGPENVDRLIQIDRLENPEVVRALAWSPDGRTLASGGGDALVDGGRSLIVLWDAAAGTERHTLRGHTSYVVSLAFSPDSQTLASTSYDETVRLWDTATGTALKVLQGHTDIVEGVAFSPDGETLASGSWDTTVRLWDAESGSPLRVLQHGNHRVYAVAFSPDGSLLASAGGDGAVRLWDAQSGAELRVLGGHTRAVSGLAFRPGSSVLATSAGDQIRLWDSTSGALQQTLPANGASLAFSPDGRILAASSDIGLWDPDSGTELRVLPNSGTRPVFSPDGRTLASQSGERTLLVWGVGR